ncbi:hypothetical protein BgiBS90_019647, partial [Biomphalaria glabrata]
TIFILLVIAASAVLFPNIGTIVFDYQHIILAVLYCLFGLCIFLCFFSYKPGEHLREPSGKKKSDQ